MRIALYGIGRNFEYFIRKKKLNEVLSDDSIVALSDSDSAKWGLIREELVVLPPEQLEIVECDCIIVTPDDSAKLLVDLKNAFSNKEIISLKEYIFNKMIHSQYLKAANGDECDYSCEPSLDLQSLVIYTSIMGGYDRLWEPRHIIPAAKYVCFTDDEQLSSDIWEIRLVKDEYSLLTDRDIKMTPHKLFPEYHTSIWVDGNIQITGNLLECIRKYDNGKKIMFFPHMERDCLYEEAATCIYWQKDDIEKIVDQMVRYREKGYPVHNGLMCGGFIVREHNNETIINAMNTWHEEYTNGSIRDQISLPYSLWKNKCEYSLINENYYDNLYFKAEKHVK